MRPSSGAATAPAPPCPRANMSLQALWPGERTAPGEINTGPGPGRHIPSAIFHLPFSAVAQMRPRAIDRPLGPMKGTHNDSTQV